jgi:hypothetical protein
MYVSLSISILICMSVYTYVYKKKKIYTYPPLEETMHMHFIKSCGCTSFAVLLSWVVDQKQLNK